jgi:hypothetical protein
MVKTADEDVLDLVLRQVPAALEVHAVQLLIRLLFQDMRIGVEPGELCVSQRRVVEGSC